MNADAAKLTQQFRKVYRNLKLFPLFEPEEIEAFREPYGQAVLGKLRREISYAPDNGKFILTGHTGCGKSTLLGQFAQQMREQQNLFVVGFSIANMVEMSDVNHVNILYSVALRLLEAADKAEVPIPKETQDALLGWFTKTKSTTYNQQIQEQLSIGANLFNFFKGKLQTEKAFREEIKETYQNSVSDLASQIDRIAAAVQIATKQEVLVIIDDRAVRFYQQQLEITQEMGDRKGEVNALGSLGIAYKNLCQYQRANGFYQQSLEISRKIGDRKGEAASQFNIGLTLLKLKQKEAARTAFREAQQLYAAIGISKEAKDCDRLLRSLNSSP